MYVMSLVSQYGWKISHHYLTSRFAYFLIKFVVFFLKKKKKKKKKNSNVDVNMAQ